MSEPTWEYPLPSGMSMSSLPLSTLDPNTGQEFWTFTREQLAARDAATRRAALAEAADAIRAEEQRFFRTWQYPGTINDARIAVERLIGGEG